jgi:hypothetical protein
MPSSVPPIIELVTDLDPELTSVEQLTVPTAPGVMSRSLAISVPVH